MGGKESLQSLCECQPSPLNGHKTFKKAKAHHCKAESICLYRFCCGRSSLEMSFKKSSDLVLSECFWRARFILEVYQLGHKKISGLLLAIPKESMIHKDLMG